MHTPATDRLPAGSDLILLEYIKDFNAAATGRRLGIPVAQVRNLVNSDDGQLAVAEQLELRTLRTGIDSDWVLLQLAEMFTADVSDIIDPNTGAFLPIHEWPTVWRKMVAGVDIKEVFEGGRAREDIPPDLVKISKIKWIDKLKALEAIGKHTNVKAFIDRVEVATDATLTEALMKGRKRIAQAAAKQADGLNFL